MNDRIFIDTNILVYSSLSDGSEKHERSVSFIARLKGNTIFMEHKEKAPFFLLGQPDRRIRT